MVVEETVEIAVGMEGDDEMSDGSDLGLSDGMLDGEEFGTTDKTAVVVRMGLYDGPNVGRLVPPEGILEIGIIEGLDDDGWSDGTLLGTMLGEVEGIAEGISEGFNVGS
eukprot:CAMPEP_0170109994 /NCGR_PEP_ID=MMETSP0020_2-20130122/7589_2 /TAXON_ID=98059 /ORGANISM="Dinobryon sp., Strain UTEXLB2267" /LENGTH=108 /DNA_ID=CAMNT_0010335195 /DNA_START=282 /DNA_END=608 /DNA_ORIENTATION=-